MSGRFRRKRSGSVAPILAVGLVALVAFMGAAVDIGRLSVIKAHMQAAGDLSATGAASSLKVTPNDPTLWAQTASLCAANFAGTNSNAPTPVFESYVTSNETNVGAVYKVGADTVTVTHPYSDSYTTSLGYDSSSLVRVDITTTSHLLLLPIIGIRTAAVTTRSVAVCLPSSNQLIFAADTDPTVYGIDFSASSATINGDVHSNTMVQMTGSSQTVNGWIDYRNGYSQTGQHDVVDPGWRVGNILNYPVWYDLSDFTIDYYEKAGMTNFNGTIPAGVYYCSGDVHINTTDVPQGPVTIIAAGDIHMSGSAFNWTAAENGVLFMSLASLGNPGGSCIQINAQGGDWTGLIFAPYGDISFTASGQTQYTGGMEAMQVSLGGQNFTCNGTLPPGPRDYSKLIE